MASTGRRGCVGRGPPACLGAVTGADPFIGKGGGVGAPPTASLGGCPAASVSCERGRIHGGALGLNLLLPQRRPQSLALRLGAPSSAGPPGHSQTWCRLPRASRAAGLAFALRPRDNGCSSQQADGRLAFGIGPCRVLAGPSELPHLSPPGSVTSKGQRRTWFRGSSMAHSLR